MLEWRNGIRAALKMLFFKRECGFESHLQYQLMFKNYKKKIVWIVVLVLIVGFGNYYYSRNKLELEKINVLINNQKYSLWVADNEVERSYGLQYISKLKNNQGMYFSFEQPKSVNFWNKNTLIDLALLWVKDNTIIGVDRLDKQNGKEPIIISSPDNINTVIELNQNQIELNNIKIGDSLIIVK